MRNGQFETRVDVSRRERNDGNILGGIDRYVIVGIKSRRDYGMRERRSQSHGGFCL